MVVKLKQLIHLAKKELVKTSDGLVVFLKNMINQADSAPPP
jgi:hypothetical protein